MSTYKVFTALTTTFYALKETDRRHFTLLRVGLLALSCSCATLWTKDVPRTVLIETQPPGAAVIIAERYQCTTPCQIALSRLSANASLSLQKRGYEVRTIELSTVTEGANGPNFAALLGTLADSTQSGGPIREQVADYVPSYRFALQPSRSNGRTDERPRPSFLEEAGSTDSSSGGWSDVGVRGRR